jgi:uncharacterized membrane protein YraQ (UPF0718 family)
MADTLAPQPNRMRTLRDRLATPWTATAGLLLLVALIDPGNARSVTVFALNAFLSTLPYIVAAVFMIAYLKAAGAESSISEAFKGRERRMIVAAALLGGLAPFCSCQVIPFIAGLLALGTPLSAVMAFWLSSPLIDPPTLLITAAALGWPFAIAKAVSAVALGLLGGFVTLFMMRAGAFSDPLKEWRPSGCCGSAKPASANTVWAFWHHDARRQTFVNETRENALFLVKWLVLAYVLEALMVHYVPADLIARVVGGEGLGPIVLSALVGMPAYLNSYVAPPLLAGLTQQGMSMGAALAFMVAGAVSSIPAMIAVWSLVKPRVFALYLGLGVIGAVISGLVFQLAV